MIRIYIVLALLSIQTVAQATEEQPKELFNAIGYSIGNQTDPDFKLTSQAISLYITGIGTYNLSYRLGLKKEVVEDSSLNIAAEYKHFTAGVIYNLKQKGRWFLDTSIDTDLTLTQEQTQTSAIADFEQSVVGIAIGLGTGLSFPDLSLRFFITIEDFIESDYKNSDLQTNHNISRTGVSVIYWW
ncbi:MAG: hypothetical protein OEY36_13600 [Gammaproteobacteria bacterium]|nr:hypothetical protein [Gammaproteobacteria bacterium]